MGSGSIAVIFNPCFFSLRLVESDKSCKNIPGKISLIKKKNSHTSKCLSTEVCKPAVLDYGSTLKHANRLLTDILERH